MREIVEWPDVGIILSDGTRLSARIWLPRDAGDDPVPAILEFLPYRKRDGTCARDALTHPYLAARGYASVRVDMRGNGDSEGLMADEYTPQELTDACEVIDWLVAQDWCAGTVGMMGISWGGFNGLQVAALAPVPLKAVISLCSTVDRFADDIHYKGGCLLGENFGWAANMWAYSSRAPDPALRPDDWREMWLERLETEPFLASIWLRHQARDAYWRHGSICEDYGAVKAKVLAIGGWADGYKNAVPEIVRNLPGAKGITGPWVHLYPHFAVPEPRIGFLQEALRWFDRWLKGRETGVEDDPSWRGYLMDGYRPSRTPQARAGRWIADDSVSGPFEHLALGAGQVLGGQAEEGAVAVTVASPASCGLGGAEYFAIGRGPELAGDQRADDALSATWISAPLAEAKDIVGRPKVVLHLSSDKPQGQVAVRLNHVHPDGARTRITFGVMNLAHRASAAQPAPTEPGQEVEIEVELDHIAYRVPEGHRLALAVSSAYWPLLWPAPEAACLTISGGTLALPVRAHSAEQDEWRFEAPEAAEPWAVEELRAPKATRRIEEDLESGVISLIIDDDHGKRRDLDHGLISGSTARERWDIHPDDPLSARAQAHWTEEMERGDIRLRTEAKAEMWADAAHFFLRARMEAWEGDALVFSREIEDEIPRENL